MSEQAKTPSFDAVKERLERIAEEVAREDIALDDALTLYEEAVSLGLSACDLSEADLVQDAQNEQASEAASDAAAPSLKKATDDAVTAVATETDAPAADASHDAASLRPGGELG